MVTPSRDVKILTSTILLHEDEATFEKELQFLIDKKDPTMVDRRDLAIIVDGDKGKIAAIRKLLPYARIFLCLWHKNENWDKNMALAVKSAQKQNSDGYEKMNIKELSVECKKRGLKFSGAKSTLIERLVENDNQHETKIKKESDEAIATTTTTTTNTTSASSMYVLIFFLLGKRKLIYFLLKKGKRRGGKERERRYIIRMLQEKVYRVTGNRFQV